MPPARCRRPGRRRRRPASASASSMRRQAREMHLQGGRDEHMLGQRFDRRSHPSSAARDHARRASAGSAARTACAGGRASRPACRCLASQREQPVDASASNAASGVETARDRAAACRTRAPARCARRRQLRLAASPSCDPCWASRQARQETSDRARARARAPERASRSERSRNSEADREGPTKGGFATSPIGHRLVPGAPTSDIEHLTNRTGSDVLRHRRRMYSAGCRTASAARSRPCPTSLRSHLRWCRQAQPPVTVPRVMALIVPRTQIAA